MALVVNNPSAKAGDTEIWVRVPVGKIPWRRKWQPTPIYLPRKFHGQRSPMGYSPWGRRVSDTTVHTSSSIVKSETESHSVMSDSLWPRGLYSPLNFPGQNTGWVAFPFSRGSCQPRDQTQVSHIAGRFFTSGTTREAQEYWRGKPIPLQQIFPTQESNQGLLHSRWILYQLSYQGSWSGCWKDL